MIPEETINRIREGVNIAELIREHLPQLKKRGRNYQACCPFHHEKTPSFHVNPEMGIFKCFGCGAGGDAFKYVMLTEGLTYPEAIRKLAQRVGIVIEEARSEAISAEERQRQRLYTLLEDAARFYHRHLLESSEALVAREYLEKRGVSSETLESFQIGFAPASGHALRDAAGRKGWDVDVLQSAGLLRRHESGRLHDHFWNRIIFPIWDVQGRVIAFGGRAMGEALPKYINSPETPIYTKSRHLYGLFQGLSTVRKSRRVVILEGYMDVSVCHQFGFSEAVATLGTALTDDHIRLLRRYAERVTLLYDPDAAGASAALRGGEMLVAEGFTVDVVTLPDQVDADEVLVNEGKAALDAFFEKALPFMDYALAQALKRHPLQRPEDKLAVAQELLPIIRQVQDPLLQDAYLTRLAEALQVEKTVLAREMKALRKSAQGSAAKATEPAVTAPETSFGGLLTLEEEILLLAVLYPSSEVYERLVNFSWQDVRCRQVWNVLGTQIAQSALDLSEAMSGLPEALQSWLTRFVMQARHYKEPLEALHDYLRAVERQQEASRLRSLQEEINSMIEGRVPLDAQKVQIYNDLARRLKGSLN